MDPTTTLFTFMLKTHPSVQTVSLVGSWDNFARQYRMDKDARRDRGQWRGCHTFKDIICDGDRPGISRRNGGLRMGQPYYYYYEVDGSYETHDTTLPSTSACPYLPGQTVNVMVVPAQVSDRTRSASLGSIRYEDFMTMDPGDKFSAPRRAPPPPAIPDFLGPRYRLPTAPARGLKHKRSDRSLSPGGANWWSRRRLFTRKQSTSSFRSDDASGSGSEASSSEVSPSTPASAPSRSMSPEDLRRFLSDETPAASEVDLPGQLALEIPDIAEEDDDDFTVASAISEFAPKTILSPPPPPSRHGDLPGSMRHIRGNDSTVTLKACQDAISAPRQQLASACTFKQNTLSQGEEDDEFPVSRFSLSSDEGSVFESDEIDPLDASHNVNDDIPSFYHSDVEDDDDDTECLSPPIMFSPKRAGFHMGRSEVEQSLARAFKGYRLPEMSDDFSIKHDDSSDAHQDGESSSAINSPPLLALPIMGDFATDLKSATGLF